MTFEHDTRRMIKRMISDARRDVLLDGGTSLRKQAGHMGMAERCYEAAEADPVRALAIALDVTERKYGGR